MTDKEVLTSLYARIRREPTLVSSLSDKSCGRIEIVAMQWAEHRGWNGGPLFELGLDEIVMGIDPDADPPNVDKLKASKIISEDIVTRLQWAARNAKH